MDSACPCKRLSNAPEGPDSNHCRCWCIPGCSTQPEALILQVEVKSIVDVIRMYQAYRTAPGWTTFDLLAQKIDARNDLVGSLLDKFELKEEIYAYRL